MAVVVSGSFSPSPSARACSDLKYDIARYVGAPNAARALAEAETCIGTAVARLNTHLWPWMLVYQDITFVAGTIDYDLASSFLAPRHAFLLDSNGNITGHLGFQDMKSHAIENDNTVLSGSPNLYSAYNAHEYGTISLDVAPNSSFVTNTPTLRLWYYQRVQPCSGSVSALDVPHEVAEWVSWYAKALMASHHDPQKFSLADQTQRDLWRGLLHSKVATELSDWS